MKGPERPGAEAVETAFATAPVHFAEQMGHADGVSLPMAVYASALGRRERLSSRTLEEYGRALGWAAMGRVQPEPGPRSGQLAESSAVGG